MSNIVLSVIIPVYNIQDYIQRCVYSIISQRIAISYEILLVDDGSTDDSSELCDRLAQEHPQIKAFHQKNNGVSAARNHGMQVSKGEWIWFIDGDDYVLPNALNRIIPDLKGCDDILTFAYIHERTTTTQRISLPTEKELTRYEGRGYMNTPYSSPTIWSYIFRRSIIFENNIELSDKLKYGEDKIFIIECLYHAKSVRLIKEPIYEYVFREGSAVNSGNERIVADQLKSIRILVKTVREKNLDIKVFDYQITYILWLYLHLLSSLDNHREYVSQENELYRFCRNCEYHNFLLFFISHFHALKLHNGIIKRFVRRSCKLKRKKYINRNA